MRKQFSTRLRRRKSFRQKTLNTATLMVFVLLPIYPVFGSYMQSYTGATVRWEYDTDSILASYDYETGREVFARSDVVEEIPAEEATPVTLIEVPIVVPAPSNTVVTPPEDKKRSLYATHTVAKGDNLWTIAQKYNINIGTIRLVNNLSSDTLSVGQKITIPRINGVTYIVKKWDNLWAISQKYWVTISNILLANDMSNAARLSVGKTLILPNPTKDPTKKAEIVQIAQVKPADKKPETKAASEKPKTPAKTEPAKDPQIITYGSYSLNLKVPKWCRGFVWWNCTCFVAKYKDVNWRGNAKDWYRNAAKAGADVGKDARPGAIIVYSGYGFPRAYGHVGIVMEVNEDHIIVKDMNYRALNEVTTRRDKISNPAIVGYIYVD